MAHHKPGTSAPGARPSRGRHQASSRSGPSLRRDHERKCSLSTARKRVAVVGVGTMQRGQRERGGGHRPAGAHAGTSPGPRRRRSRCRGTGAARTHGVNLRFRAGADASRLRKSRFAVGLAGCLPCPSAASGPTTPPAKTDVRESRRERAHVRDAPRRCLPAVTLRPPHSARFPRGSLRCCALISGRYSRTSWPAALAFHAFLRARRDAGCARARQVPLVLSSSALSPAAWLRGSRRPSWLSDPKGSPGGRDPARRAGRRVRGRLSPASRTRSTGRGTSGSPRRWAGPRRAGTRPGLVTPTGSAGRTGVLQCLSLCRADAVGPVRRFGSPPPRTGTHTGARRRHWPPAVPRACPVRQCGPPP